MLYAVGLDFCIEDPMNTPFQVLIVCRLENEPQPRPEFYWSIFYNDTELEYDSSSILQGHDEFSIFPLSGTIGLGENLALRITCTIENSYGSDTENTLIRLCGKIFLSFLVLALIG